jgi:hypothetical protein
MTAIRLGVMSDLHIEFEPDYWQPIERSARRGDSSTAAEGLRLALRRGRAGRMVNMVSSCPAAACG